MPISPFKRAYLWKIAVAISACVLETLLTPARLFCNLTFETIQLNSEEFDEMERLIKGCLDSYASAVCIVAGSDKISVSLLQSQGSPRVLTQAPSRGV